MTGEGLRCEVELSDRIPTESAFAKLCGVAPQPASSGRSSGRHRLSRGGDRAANSALYIVTIVRMRHHQPTRDYVQRRTAEGLSKREIIRCLIGEVSVMRPGIGLDRGFSVVSGDGLVAEPL